ncbi:hypothetical protein GGF50DRAFT_19449, partial [Schizophyllum commune]
LPWLRKHNPLINWNDLTIQFDSTLRAMTFEPETRTRLHKVAIEVLPRDEMDWVGSPPDDPNALLEDTEPAEPRTERVELRWDEPAHPQVKNSKQRKR